VAFEGEILSDVVSLSKTPFKSCEKNVIKIVRIAQDVLYLSHGIFLLKTLSPTAFVIIIIQSFPSARTRMMVMMML